MMPSSERLDIDIWSLLTALALSAILSTSCARTGDSTKETEIPTTGGTGTAGEITLPGAAPTSTAEIILQEPNSSSAPATPPVPTADSTASADVMFVRAVQTGQTTWTFHVTVQYPDAGWEDYADGWDIVLPDNTVIKPDPDSPFTRLLLHPHVDEQPFTRSQTQIVIPVEVTRVVVRAHDLIHGYGGRQVSVDLTTNWGPDFEIERLTDED